MTGGKRARPAVNRRFLLPRGTAVGRTWYHERSGTQLRRYRVISRTATAAGHTGLLRIQIIDDDDANGVFQPLWSGPDRREDQFWEGTAGLFRVLTGISPDGGSDRI